MYVPFWDEHMVLELRIKTKKASEESRDQMLTELEMVWRCGFMSSGLGCAGSIVVN
jgi:hypothetical protein